MVKLDDASTRLKVHSKFIQSIEKLIKLLESADVFDKLTGAIQKLQKEFPFGTAIGIRGGKFSGFRNIQSL